MWVLVLSVILFVVLTAFLIYSNWPKHDIKPPELCNKCGMPMNECGCCKFC